MPKLLYFLAEGLRTANPFGLTHPVNREAFSPPSARSDSCYNSRNTANFPGSSAKCSMQPERLEKVKSLLASALSVPPAEREAFLRGACAGDPSLRHDIDSYLGHGDRTDRFFHQAQTVPNAHISLENPSAQVTMQIQVDPRIGRDVGKYHIRNRVAEGGMGVVYLATDTQLGRDVAIKVLPEFFSMDRERLSRFHREARATSLLNHPNIVTVFEMGQWEGCEFIVTEYIEGRTLRDLMRQGQIPFVEMLKIASQVAGLWPQRTGRVSSIAT